MRWGLAGVKQEGEMGKGEGGREEGVAVPSVVGGVRLRWGWGYFGNSWELA